MIRFMFLRQDLYHYITFFVHDTLPYLNQKYLAFDISDTFNISVVVRDISIFTDKRINLGFFELRHDLCGKFYLTGMREKDMAFCFLKLLKINF